MQVCEFIFTARFARGTEDSENNIFFIAVDPAMRDRVAGNEKALSSLRCGNHKRHQFFGLSRFAFRRPCTVECLPCGMRSLFNWGGAYSSGVSEK